MHSEITLSELIAASTRAIISAGVLANDKEEACKLATHTYGPMRGNREARAIASIQASARNTIVLANRFGLTVEKPYFVKGDTVFGVFFDDVVALKSFGSIAPQCRKIALPG